MRLENGLSVNGTRASTYEQRNDSVKEPVLTVRNFNVEFGDPSRPVCAVANASLNVYAGEILGIVGESGSGKTTLCAGMIRTLSPQARISGEIRYLGRDMYRLSRGELRALRGTELTMILQNPMTSLDPLFTVGGQIAEVLRERHGYARDESRKAAVDVLRKVHLTAPQLRARQYPHQLSGGMRQRVLTGLATTKAPRIVIADEPTTALDATIQEEILVLFREIRDRARSTIIIVTHDLGVIRRLCDRIIIMYAGSIVEEGSVSQIFETPIHPYTKGLLASIPRIEDDTVVLKPIPGQVPRLDKLGPGCAFAERCDQAFDTCHTERPPMVELPEAHRTMCWRAGEIKWEHDSAVL
jgi:oligopeptide/dipeptide ABC transporter ATP-binding protein